MRVTHITEMKDDVQPRRRAPVLWPWALVIVAWTLAGLSVLTNQSYLINHHYLLEESHLPVLVALVIFLACWQVMTVGMMLPSSMPMVYMIVHAGRQQKRPHAVPAAFLAAYALVWTAFALVAFLGDTRIHWLVDHWFWLYTHSWLIGATTFAIAGVFQFTPLKGRCLKQCRSPFSFFVRYYREGVGAAWCLGLRHGAFCLGCCWALMLVMFGIGVGSLLSMALLTGVMIVEKTYPRGQRLSPVIGIILLGLSVLWLVHPAWLLSGVGV
jgi:predicted metal-binding membrane protein